MSDAERIRVRPWQVADRESLLRYANNRNVWLNLTDAFPHPYTAADADSWLGRQTAHAGLATHFAIELRGQAIGGVGFEIRADVHRLSAAIGYWVGKPFWGRGIATAALRQTSTYAFQHFELERLEATVFEWNPASARVLEKAGYRLEGRLRRSIVKDGRVGDALIYARLRAEEVSAV